MHSMWTVVGNSKTTFTCVRFSVCMLSNWMSQSLFIYKLSKVILVLSIACQSAFRGRCTNKFQ